MHQSHLKTHWPYIAVAYMGLFCLGLLDNTRGPFYPDIINDLSLSDSRASYFFSLASLTAFLGSHLSQVLIGRLSSLGGLRLGLLLMAVGCSAMGLSQGLVGLLAWAGVFGLGFGIVSVFQNIAIQEGASNHLRRRLFSGLHSMYAFAALVAPLIASGFYQMGWSWRNGFLLLGLLPLLAALGSWPVKHLKPTDSQALGTPDEHIKEVPIMHLVYVALIIAFYIAAELSISTRLVLYLRREFDFSPELAPQFLALFFLFLLMGRLFFTVFNFARFSSAAIMVGCLLLSTVLYLTGIYVTPWGLLLCGLSMAPFFGVSMDYLVGIFGKKASHAMAYSMAVGALVVVFMHYLVGLLTELVGIQRALLIGPVCLLTSLTLLFFRARVFALRPKSKENVALVR